VTRAPSGVLQKMERKVVDESSNYRLLFDLTAVQRVKREIEMNKHSWSEVAVMSDLFSLGRDEDGTEIIGDVFFVQVSSDYGRTLVHNAAFPNKARASKEEQNAAWDDGFDGVLINYDFDAEAKAERLAKRIEAHLACGGKLNQDHWSEGNPRYASQAYQNEGGEEDMIAWERRLEEDAAFK